jgi:hypothetical protein
MKRINDAAKQRDSIGQMFEMFDRVGINRIVIIRRVVVVVP